MNEDSLCQSFVRVDSLVIECPEDAPMIEVVIVGICVDIGQGHTVQLCIGEGVNQLRLEMLLILGNEKQDIY